MNYFFRILFFFSTLLSSFAQNSTISGFAPAYKGKELTLFINSDYISNTEIPVSVQVVSDSGFFNFTFQADDIKHILLRSGKQKASMYIEPGHDYRVYMPAPDTMRFVNPNVEQTIDLTFAITDTTEINALVISYNERFEKWWAENFQYFVQKKSRARLDSFELEINAHYASLNKPYFKAYVSYNIAELDLNTFQSKNELANKYIIDKPLLYDNFEYMSFFNKFFKHYLEHYSMTKNGSVLTEQINEKASYMGCMEALSADKFLQNDTLRELVLIKGLSELYYSPEFRRENVLLILEHIASSSKIVLHQTIAANVIHSFSKLQPGAVAPQFSLFDKNGKVVNLSDFKGKYVYLDFWATWCTPCLQEMKLIPYLKKTYGEKIVFISINIDEDAEQMKKFLAKNPKYDWVFLHFGNDKKVKDQYEIKSVPSYFLINAYGNFIQSPALRPTQSIESSFYEIAKKKSGTKKGP